MNATFAERAEKLASQLKRGLISVDEYSSELIQCAANEVNRVTKDHNDRCPYVSTTMSGDDIGVKYFMSPGGQFADYEKWSDAHSEITECVSVNSAIVSTGKNNKTGLISTYISEERKI